MRRYIVRKDLIAENIRVVKAAAGSAKIYGVLKGDGYGLGLGNMAQMLSAQGICSFAVTEAEDALALLGLGVPVREILLLRPLTDLGQIERLLGLPVIFSVGTTREVHTLAMAAELAGVTAEAHIQVDCGLGRYGFRACDVDAVRRLYEFDSIHFSGIYTHFSCACRAARTYRQYARFNTLIRALEAAGIDPGTRHCCASSALFRYPALVLDAVRVGSAFLGRIPDGKRFGLIPVGYCEADIEVVKTLPAGSTAGYGALFRARRDMRVAVVDAGAVHGFGMEPKHGRQGIFPGFRELMRLTRGKSGLFAVVDGRKTPVLGEVCAECAMVDVTECTCAPGDTVRLYINPLYQRHMDCVWTAEPDIDRKAI